MVTAFSYAFYDWRGTARGGFAGLENFTTLFTEAPYADQLPRAFGHNLLFFAGTMLVQNTLGLGFAVLLHRGRRSKRLLQTLYAMPYLVSPLVIGYLWTLLLSPTFGPVNALLEAVGLGSLAQPWLGDPTTALPVIVLISAWQWVGFPVLLYGAALGGLPEELSEAARMDGASSWQVFRRITLPLLLPAIGTVGVLTFIMAMEAFALPYALGGSTGSPAGATDVLSLLFYRTAFESGATNAIGVSSALATVLFAVIFGGAVLATRVLRRQEEAMLR
ncbi:sugar ABC transporter permease [Vallicoccus soli]|uniref:Sugar ABC transporter permease n=2 Tax=Vallicoccus soli TaxID=2339232 RepID=A0A3A3Z5Y9_9ACTN|nr:sugar ABC transporter permease [Vallicoccus soli]